MQSSDCSLTLHNNVLLCSPTLYTHWQDGHSALYYACKVGNVDIAATLLAKGADILMIDKVRMDTH
jgi:ankyrin repeat protein